jgi:hypothetical protein
MRAKAAGEIFAVLSWAERKCSGTVSDKSREELLAYRSTDPNRFDDGAMAGRRNVEQLYRVYGITSFCEIVIAPHASNAAAWNLFYPALTAPAWTEAQVFAPLPKAIIDSPAIERAKGLEQR